MTRCRAKEINTGEWVYGWLVRVGDKFFVIPDKNWKITKICGYSDGSVSCIVEVSECYEVDSEMIEELTERKLD